MSKEVFMQALPAAIIIVPRSRVRPTYRYTVQTQSANQSWEDSTSTHDRKLAVEIASLKRALGDTVRVVDNEA